MQWCSKGYITILLSCQEILHDRELSYGDWLANLLVCYWIVLEAYRDYTSTCRLQPVLETRLTKAAIRHAVMSLAGFLAFAIPCLAQLPPGPPANRTNPDRERQQDMNRREMLLRGYGLERATPDNRKEIQVLAEQVQQDFQRILILHNEIARAISGDKELDYGFVSDATGEIKKRASRLQATLLFKPRDDQNAEKLRVPDDTQLKDVLIILCHQIKNFVTNPVIENPGTVSVEQLDKARGDLQSIIDLTSRSKRTAENLAKSHR